jgi:hypothetical protein
VVQVQIGANQSAAYRMQLKAVGTAQVPLLEVTAQCILYHLAECNFELRSPTLSLVQKRLRKIDSGPHEPILRPMHSASFQ